MGVNEHSARIESSKGYVDFARKNNFFYKKSKNPADKDIDVVFGIRKEEGPRGGRSEIQSIRFKSTKWTPEEAKTWLKEHDFKSIKFEEASGETVKEDSQAAITTSSLGAGAYHRRKALPTVYRHKPSGFSKKVPKDPAQPFMQTMQTYLK